MVRQHAPRSEIAEPLDVAVDDPLRVERELRTDFTYGATDRVGIYQVKGNDLDRSFAVNLLDSAESRIEPNPAVQIGSEKVVTGEERSQPREIWKWFALIALIVLLAEWYIYNRRIYI